LVDANVLVNAVNEASPLHAAAVGWLDAELSSGETVGLDWTVLLAFVRLATHRAIFERPLTVGQALAQVESWLAAPRARAVSPGPTHFARLRDLLTEVGTGGNLTNDAHLAALALEFDAAVVTFDSDFARFRGVKWLSPPPAG
jgi:toxin-antitoxin system PIN domain toxin